MGNTVEGLNRYFSTTKHPRDSWNNAKTWSGRTYVVLKVTSCVLLILPLLIVYGIAKAIHNFHIATIAREQKSIYLELSDLDLDKNEDYNIFLQKVDAACKCAEQGFFSGATSQATQYYQKITTVILNYDPAKSDILVNALRMVFESTLKTSNIDEATRAYNEITALLPDRDAKEVFDDLKLCGIIAKIINKNFPDSYDENFRSVLDDIIDIGNDLLSRYANDAPEFQGQELTTLKEQLEILESRF